MYNSIPNSALNEALGGDPAKVAFDKLDKVQCIKWIREQHKLTIREAKNITDYHIESPKKNSPRRKPKKKPESDAIKRLRSSLFEVEEVARILSRSNDSSILDVAARLSDICEEAKGGESDIETIRAHVDQMGSEITLFTETLTKLVARVNTLEHDVGDISGATISDDLLDLRSKIDGLENEGFAEQINDVSKEVSDVKSALESSVEDNESKIDANDSEIKAIKSTVDDLQMEVNNLDTKIDNVESKIPVEVE